MVKPSIAEVTVILGVIIPSASRAQPPTMAGTTSHLAFLRTSENKEKIPPSPLLSARKVIITYFTVVCRVSVQMIQDNTPSTLVGLISCLPPRIMVKIAFKVYNGDVPISPNTIPKLIRTPPAVNALTFL
ncbi:hypothetical protein D3C85_1312860 [compost metagenome]